MVKHVEAEAELTLRVGLMVIEARRNRSRPTEPLLTTVTMRNQHGDAANFSLMDAERAADLGDVFAEMADFLKRCP